MEWCESKPLRYQWMAVVFSGVFQVSEEVSVQHVVEPITARDSARLVILPCVFLMETYETPQITWYHETFGERRLIMQYDIHNRLSSYGEFEGRVVRGDRGALVLLRPRSRDSGNYSCEVEVDNESPSWVKSTVMLKVTKDTVATNENNAKNTTVLVSVYWLISVMCALLLNTGLRTLARNAFYPPGNMPRTQRIKHKSSFPLVLFSLVIVFAMSLIFAGVICAVKSMGKSEGTTVNSYHWTVSLITGIPGILILLLITAWSCLPAETFCKKKCLGRSGIQESHEMSPDQTTAACYIAPTDTQDPISHLMQPITHARPKKGGAVTFKNERKERVTGMVSLGKNGVFVTTKHSLFELNLAGMIENKHFQTIHAQDKEFLSLAKFKDGLLICVDEQSITSKHYLLKWEPENDEFHEVLLPVKSPILWVQEGRGDGLVYVAFSNPDVISKRNLEKKTGDQIWNSVLKKPECIVQNSRGQFIVADSFKNDLFVFEEDGEFLSTMKVSVPKQFGEKLNKCNRIAIDEDNRIYVSGPVSSDVLVFNEDFRFERLFPTFSASADGISCLLVHRRLLYVAQGGIISAYPLHSGIL